MDFPADLNQSEIIEENISYHSDSDNQSYEINEFTQDIVKILFYLNNYNNNLISSIKRDYPSEFKYHKNYSNKYYCINSKWMNYFLELYNYKKIRNLINEFSIKSEEELYAKIRKKEIPLKSGYNNSNIESIKFENFEPKKSSIKYDICNVYKSGELARYFDDFALVDKKLFEETKQYYKNLINFDYDKDKINENKVKICLVDDIFIYKINENTLGIGIPEISMKTEFPIFKIQFFIIINEKYSLRYINEEDKINSDSEINEILKSKDLETYLITNRKVRFDEPDNSKKINMKFNGNIIGFIYNINDFKIEKYWGRTKEKYLKRMELKKIYKELERANRKKEEEKLREKEKKQDQMFRDTLMKKSLNIYKKEEHVKEIIFGRLKYSNRFENNKLDPVKSNLKLINNIPKDKIQNEENNRYAQNETKEILPKIYESFNNQGFPKKDNIRAQTEENKQIYLIKNKNIRNSFSEKKMNNKLNKIINSSVKPKIEKNNNVNFKSSKNFFNKKYILPKLEIQTNPKCNKKVNNELDIVNNKKNVNILTKEHTKKLKEIVKKENTKTENMVKMKEKEKQEKNKKKQGNEEINRKFQEKIEKKEEMGKYNIFNYLVN